MPVSPPPATLFAGTHDLDTLKAALNAAGTRTVSLIYFDPETVARLQRLDVGAFLGFARNGLRFTDGGYHWDLAEVHYGSYHFPDQPAAVDLGSGRLHPFRDDEALFLFDHVGETARLSPRTLAKAQVERAAAMGFEVLSAVEYEFTVLNETPESVRAKGWRDLATVAPGNRTLSAIVPSVHEEFFEAHEAMCQRMGITLDCVHTEFGDGCFETPLRYASGLKPLDDAALFKTFTKAFALRRGMMACFMSKWSNRASGQSGHMHLSLRDAKSGAPLFHGPDGGPSALARHFIAGVLALLPEALSLCCHTVNAYRRLVPGHFVATAANWGIENRTCALRVIPGSPSATRVEFRTPSADSNPYLTLALLLGAGLDGIERGIEPSPPIEGDADALVFAPEQRFATGLGAAADRLERSREARRLFGDAFVDYWVKARRWEDERCREHIGAWDLERYLETS